MSNILSEKTLIERLNKYGDFVVEGSRNSFSTLDLVQTINGEKFVIHQATYKSMVNFIRGMLYVLEEQL